MCCILKPEKTRCLRDTVLSSDRYRHSIRASATLQSRKTRARSFVPCVAAATSTVVRNTELVEPHSTNRFDRHSTPMDDPAQHRVPTNFSRKTATSRRTRKNTMA
ncbi:unnamed protein product [Ectocarpus sp. 4 AP-2014]